MPETTPLIKAALNLRGGAGFDVYDWVRERMVSIINTRVSNNLTTIYTSNLSPEELRGELGDRIASRVLGSSQVVEITSGDRRGL